MGDYHAAINLMDRCLDLNPDNLSYQISRCCLLVSIGSFEGAVIGFEKVYDTYFDDYNLVKLFYLKYGQALQRMGKYDDALRLYNEYLCRYDGFPKDEIMAERDKALGQMH
jgi:tetratricopeptide (TPR) repeat protein